MELTSEIKKIHLRINRCLLLNVITFLLAMVALIVASN